MGVETAVSTSVTLDTVPGEDIVRNGNYQIVLKSPNGTKDVLRCKASCLGFNRIGAVFVIHSVQFTLSDRYIPGCHLSCPFDCIGCTVIIRNI
jgi:hypothetical protein